MSGTAAIEAAAMNIIFGLVKVIITPLIDVSTRGGILE